MLLTLDVISGICWSIVYIIANIIGFRCKTWCIPKVAVCTNFSWEFLVVTYRLLTGQIHSFAFLIQFVWLILDIGILTTWLLYDTRDRRYALRNILLFILVFASIYLIACRQAMWEYVAFIINLLMSILFVYRLYKDPQKKWISFTVGICKMLGTMAATLRCGILCCNSLIAWLGGLCFIADVLYITLLIGNERRKR